MKEFPAQGFIQHILGLGGVHRDLPDGLDNDIKGFVIFFQNT